MSKSRKRHNNSHTPNNIPLEPSKREKLSSTRYWRPKAATSLGKKHSYYGGHDSVSRKTKFDREYQKSISGHNLLKNASITLRDAKLGKIMFNGRIKPIKLQHHMRPKR